ncbi:MAG: haloalkane dehalogenase [Chloroflexales bacterium]|nr:haloalkane dehalogenase [Chloroflexales bacterium]
MQQNWRSKLGIAAALGVGFLIWRSQRQRRANVVSMGSYGKILRTPESRFANLPGYPFAPHYVEVDGLRMHYVDEGPRTGEIVLMLHGEPSWSYLYRKMIPLFTAAGYRALAPDLIGFGKSDKLAEKRAYTYQRHVDWMWAWLQALDLHNITLVCQDWGSLLGLRLVAEHPERFARVVVANGALPTGDQELPSAFKTWLAFSQQVPVLPIGRIIQTGTQHPVDKAVLAAYNAPFPSEAYKAGARIFPTLAPITPDNPAAPANRRAWEALARFDKPFLTAFSDGDPIMRGGERIFQQRVPGAHDQAHTTIRGAGHFLQEDQGEELARVTLEFMAANPQREHVRASP